MGPISQGSTEELVLAIQPDQKKILTHETPMNPLLSPDIQGKEINVFAQPRGERRFALTHMFVASARVGTNFRGRSLAHFLKPVRKSFNFVFLPMRKTLPPALVIFETHVDATVFLVGDGSRVYRRLSLLHAAIDAEAF
jgi:hypothetical protein